MSSRTDTNKGSLCRLTTLLTAMIVAGCLLGGASTLAQSQCATNGNPVNCFQTGAPTVLSVYQDGDGDGMFGPSDPPVIGSTVLTNGSLVFYQVRILHTWDPALCAFQGGAISIKLPNNVVVPVTPPGGIPLVCAGPDCDPTIPCVPHVDSIVAPYVVNIADDGTDPDGLLNGRLQAVASYTGGRSWFDFDCEEATGTATISIEPVIPCISVKKEVACKVANGTCQTYGPAATGYKLGGANPEFCYRITLSNCTSKAVIVVSVVDNTLGNLTSLFPTKLAKGQSVTVNVTTNHATTTMNTVTAQVQTDTAPALPASGSSSALAEVKLAGVSCDVEAIPAAVEEGTTTPVTYKVTVHNLGDSALNNIVVTDDRCGTVGTIASLAAHAQATVQCTANLVAPSGCAGAPYRNNVKVTSSTGGECPVHPESTCYVDVGCSGTPAVKITKKVACYEAPDCLLPFGDVAYGVKTATQCPAFCYQITISNPSPSVVLYNVAVSDSDLDLSGCMFPTTLLPGQAASCIVKGVERCDDFVNVATVSGSGGTPVTNITDTADAHVFIKNAGIMCVKEVSLDGVTYLPEVQLTGDGNVYYRITVKGLSDPGVTLGNIVVSDPLLANCDIASQVPATLTGTDSFTINCVLALTCADIPADGLVNTATVTADVVAAGDIKCVKDKNGNKITVMTQCSAKVLPCGGACVTRTPGYWFTHWKNQSTPYNPYCATLYEAIKANGGEIDLGYMKLTGTLDEVLSKALGFFWGKRNNYGDGSRASALCRARKKLSWHLIAAIANVKLLGTNPSSCMYMDSMGNPKHFPADLLEKAVAAAAGCDIKAMNYWQGMLDAFNNSGDDNDFPPGLYPCRADPRGARKAAVDVTSPANCGAPCP